MLKKITLPSLLLYLLNPFLSFFYSLAVMTKKSVDNSFVIAISIATILVYFPIMYDTSANFYAYYEGVNSNPLDIYRVIPELLRGYFGLNYYFFILISTVFVIYSWSKITKLHHSLVIYRKGYIYWAIIFLFTFTYRDMMDLNRNILAFAISFYYIFYLREVKKNVLYMVLCILLSLSVHISSALVWIVYLISLRINFKRYVWYFIIIGSILLGWFMPFFAMGLSSHIGALGGTIGGKINNYLYGDSFGIHDVASIGALLKKVLNITILIATAFYSVKCMSRDKDRYKYSFTVIICCITLLFMQYLTFFERLNLAVCFTFSFVYISKNKLPKLKSIIVFFIFFRSFYLTFFFYFPTLFLHYNDVLIESAPTVEIAMKPFYLPSPLLLDMKNGYSDEYLLKYDVWKDYN